jgi:hypothetical protein
MIEEPLRAVKATAQLLVSFFLEDSLPEQDGNKLFHVVSSPGLGEFYGGTKPDRAIYIVLWIFGFLDNN